jgi:hypothetical protein
MKMILRKGNLYWECPAPNCGLVRIPVEGSTSGETKWAWNGSLDKPTLTPSVKVTWDFGDPPATHNCCHFNVTDGVIHFHGDCTHDMKNQTIPMPEITEEFRVFLGDD